MYWQKLMRNNPDLDLVNINAYAKFGLIPSIHSQDIEQKPSWNHGQVQNSTPSPQKMHNNPNLDQGGGGGGGVRDIERKRICL